MLRNLLFGNSVRIVIGIILSFAVVSTTLAQTEFTLPAKRTNGCGPEGFGWLVPNSTLLSGCKFKTACDAHDECYGHCLKGGDYYGQPKCNANTAALKKARLVRKRRCDKALRDGIEKLNPGRSICRTYASGYNWFVSNLGDGSFKGAEGMAEANAKVYRNFIQYVSKHPDAFAKDDLNKLFEAQAKSIEFSSNSVKFDPSTPELIIYQSIPSTSKRNIITVTGKKPSN